MRSAIFLLAALPALAQAQDAQALVNRMLQQLDSAAWGALYAGGNSCRQYSGSVDGQPFSAVDEWSWHCDRTAAEITVESYYYAVSKDLLLQRADIGLAEAAQGASAAVRQLVETKLTQRFGSPVTSPPAPLYPIPGAPVVRISQWHTGGAYLLLFDGPFYRSPDRPLKGVRLIAIARPLDDRMHDDQKLGAARDNLADLVTDRLKKEPGLYKSVPATDDVVRLLRAAQTAQAGRKAEMLLAADLMVSRLSGILGDGEHAAAAEDARQQLAPFGVRLGPQRKDDLDYERGLLVDVWMKYPNTEWGEYAFLLLQLAGWNPGADGYSRPGNPDEFREVAEHGEAFLAGYPQSTIRLQVLFTIATAYETWWSITLVPANEENYGIYPRRAEDDRRREDARLKAISDYEQIERLAPASDYALFAQRHLARLRLGLDTGLRWWFDPGD